MNTTDRIPNVNAHRSRRAARALRILPLSLLLLLLGACGGSGSDDTVDRLQTESLPTDTETGPNGPTTYYVDSLDGDDANPGTTDLPFKTITHALREVALAGDTVRVREGPYREATGEDFPLVVPEGVALVGNVFYRGRGIEISGSGLYRVPGSIEGAHATIVAGPNSTVAGLTVENPVFKTEGFAYFANVVIAAPYPDATIRGCTIESQPQLSNGIRFLPDATGITVENCDIRGAHAGLWFDRDGGLDSVVEGTTVTGNEFGVVYPQSRGGADLGGGPAGSAGGNTLAGNTSADLLVLSSHPVHAANTYWDGRFGPSVFTGDIGDHPAGVDILRAPSATVHTPGARWVDERRGLDP